MSVLVKEITVYRSPSHLYCGWFVNSEFYRQSDALGNPIDKAEGGRSLWQEWVQPSEKIVAALIAFAKDEYGLEIEAKNVKVDGNYASWVAPWYVARNEEYVAIGSPTVWTCDGPWNLTPPPATAWSERK